jgi:hypothetical protein
LVEPFKKTNVGLSQIVHELFGSTRIHEERVRDIAVTEYFLATSDAASTSHFKKLTLGYCFGYPSNVGENAIHG